MASSSEEKSVMTCNGMAVVCGTQGQQLNIVKQKNYFTNSKKSSISPLFFIITQPKDCTYSIIWWHAKFEIKNLTLWNVLKLSTVSFISQSIICLCYVYTPATWYQKNSTSISALLVLERSRPHVVHGFFHHNTWVHPCFILCTFRSRSFVL